MKTELKNLMNETVKGVAKALAFVGLSLIPAMILAAVVGIALRLVVWSFALTYNLF